jgi:tetratricopeptide (TPR) repeat protein
MSKPDRAGRKAKSIHTPRPPAVSHPTRRLLGLVVIGILAQVLFLAAWRGVLAEHYARRAQEELNRGRLATAAALADRSLALNPRQGYAAYYKGRALNEMARASKDPSRFQQADSLLQLAARTMPHRAEALRQLALVEEQRRDNKAAAAHLAEALAIEPMPPGPGGPAEWRARLGRLLLNDGRWVEGFAQFRTAVADAPDSRLYFDGLTLAYEHFAAPDLATASALALLRSARHAGPILERALEHLKRLSARPAEKQFILTTLRAIRSAPQTDKTVLELLDRTLKELEKK